MSKKMMKLTACSLIVATTLCFGVTAPVAAEQFPDKPVLAIVPFGAGGGNDILLRLMAKHANDYLGQPLVVENKPGASGQIGWTALSKATPDGYTVGATSLPSMVLIKAMRPNTPFELADFTYVCTVQVDPIVWVVRADSPYQSGGDLVKAMASGDKPMNVAGDGPQSNIQLQHLAATKTLGVNTNFVPFNGSSAALTALLGEKVDLAAATLSAARSNLDAGKLRALVVFSDDPVSSLSGVPTASAELGKPIASVGMAMRGIAAPKDVAPERIQKLEQACQQIVQSKAFAEESDKLGLMIKFMDSKQSTAAVEESAQAVESLKELLK